MSILKNNYINIKNKILHIKIIFKNYIKKKVKNSLNFLSKIK